MHANTQIYSCSFISIYSQCDDRLKYHIHSETVDEMWFRILSMDFDHHLTKDFWWNCNRFWKTNWLQEKLLNQYQILLKKACTINRLHVSSLLYCQPGCFNLSLLLQVNHINICFKNITFIYVFKNTRWTSSWVTYASATPAAASDSNHYTPSKPESENTSPKIIPVLVPEHALEGYHHGL